VNCLPDISRPVTIMSFTQTLPAGTPAAARSIPALRTLRKPFNVIPSPFGGLRTLSSRHSVLCFDTVTANPNFKQIAARAINVRGGGHRCITQALNIVFVSAEVAPWSKTGGLGDVVGGLPIELAKRGHKVMTVAPRYYHVNTSDDAFLLRYFVSFCTMELFCLCSKDFAPCKHFNLGRLPLVI
jgi:hypothetical protein